MATYMGTTEASLEWAIYNGTNNHPSSFRVNCQPTPSVSDIIDIIALSDHLNVTSFTHLLTGLEEYTNYTCSIIARNIFGDGPTSNTTDLTQPPGIMF